MSVSRTKKKSEGGMETDRNKRKLRPKKAGRKERDILKEPFLAVRSSRKWCCLGKWATGSSIEKTLGTACRTVRLKQNGLPTTNSCHCLRTEAPFSLGRE